VGRPAEIVDLFMGLQDRAKEIPSGESVKRVMRGYLIAIALAPGALESALTYPMAPLVFAT
jgi:hypothetical protein